ncbi:MAG TPA: 3-hydroxybutyryl-CoA dehydrogenase [Candidatus Binatia bacterium]|nr:3-hydroxybutyryl-CoA dehydrogenase [Candidatus Binatia bacterium]
MPPPPTIAGVEIETVGVAGAGQMGAGISEVCATRGLRVAVVEVSAELAEAGRRRIEQSMARAVERGKLSEAERDAALGRITVGTDLEAFRGADMVIEAIPENLALKREMFTRIDAIAPDRAILATNTSALPVIEIARVTDRPEQVVGTHFFNPPPVMRLLELVRTVATADGVVDTARGFGERLGKRVIVAQDRGGFIVNLLLVPFLTSAIRLYEAGFASREDIDDGMRLGCNHPMGPLQLIDYIGLDTHLAVCDALYEEYALPEYAAPPLLKRMVAAGWLGRKSGRGFYDYRDKPPAKAG